MRGHDAGQHKGDGQNAAIVALAVLTALLMFGRLGTPPLTTANEGLYAQVAREMLETGQWIVPHINSVVYFEKPPLLYWLVALSMRLFGENATAARLPSALAGAAIVSTVFWLAGLMFGRAARIPAALIMATSLGFLLMARQVMFDSLLTAAVTVSLAGFYAAWRLDRRRFSYLGYLGLAAATMAKGFVAPALVVLIFLCWSASARDLTRLRPLTPLGPILLYLLLVAPWHIAISLQRPDFVWFYFYNEHIGRFLGTRQPKDWRTGAFYTPFLGLLLLTTPWAFLLPAALYNALSHRRCGPSARGNSDFLICWLLVPLAFFALSGNRQYAYAMPAAPAVGLLVGVLWQAANTGSPSPRLSAWVRVPIAAFLLLVAAAWLACGLKAGVPGSSGERATLLFVGLSAFIVSLSYGLSLPPSRGLSPLFRCTAAGAATAWLLAMLIFRSIPGIQTEEPLARALIACNPPEGAVVAVEGRLEDSSSFLFYLPRRLRPVFVVEGRTGGDLQYGSTDPSVRRLFLSAKQFAELCARREVFYLTNNPPRLPLPPGMQKIDGTRKKILWHRTALRPPTPRPILHQPLGSPGALLKQRNSAALPALCPRKSPYSGLL